LKIVLIMEDLSNNPTLIAQVEFVLSKAIRYPQGLGYKVELINKHQLIADTPVSVSVRTDPGKGYQGNFYHDYDSTKDQHDFSGSATACFSEKTETGIVNAEHHLLFTIRNIGVNYQQNSFTLLPHANTVVAIAVS